jgi:peroxiredoxin Q/BCP
MANHTTSLRAGDEAPFFEGQDQDGKKISLDEFRNKKLVLFFYPKDDTPTCTKEVCNLRDNFGLLKKKGYVVVGVSADEVKKHKKFITKYELPFRLIADTGMEIIKAYDVWGEKLFMGRLFDGIARTTFVIEKGLIKKVISKVDSGDHASQIIEEETK